MTPSELKQFYKTFLTLEKACVTMYEVIMKQKTKLDELEKRMAALEGMLNEKDNSR
jgi:hypothetical protein